MSNKPQWIPHQRETWTARYGELKANTVFQDGIFPKIVEAGTTVKIVMVSRFGDVGITDDLTEEYGYKARIPLDGLDNLRASDEPLGAGDDGSDAWDGGFADNH